VAVDDFKPASVAKQHATLSMSEDERHVTVSHGGDGPDGSAPTVFEGPRRDCTNECVLIFDPDTRSFVLERLSSSVTVKRVRSASTVSPAIGTKRNMPIAAKQKRGSGGSSGSAGPRKPATPVAGLPATSLAVAADNLDKAATPEKASRAGRKPVSSAAAVTAGNTINLPGRAAATAAGTLPRGRPSPSAPDTDLYMSSSGSESTEDEGVAEFKARIARKRASDTATPVQQPAGTSVAASAPVAVRPPTAAMHASTTGATDTLAAVKSPMRLPPSKLSKQESPSSAELRSLEEVREFLRGVCRLPVAFRSKRC